MLVECRTIILNGPLLKLSAEKRANFKSSSGKKRENWIVKLSLWKTPRLSRYLMNNWASVRDFLRQLKALHACKKSLLCILPQDEHSTDNNFTKKSINSHLISQFPISKRRPLNFPARPTNKNKRWKKAIYWHSLAIYWSPAIVCRGLWVLESSFPLERIRNSPSIICCRLTSRKFSFRLNCEMVGCETRKWFLLWLFRRRWWLNWQIGFVENDSLCCNEMCRAGHFPILPALLESIWFRSFEAFRRQAEWKFMKLSTSTNIILMNGYMNEKLQINSISNYTFLHYANTDACSHFLLNLKQ